MTPFLSIITRCFLRPKQLECCINSVRNQTDPDFEHIFIQDDKGAGLFWANSQIFENKDRVNGKWVYVLDDDDHLTYTGFVKDLKHIAAENPDVGLIIFKGYIGNSLYPTEGFWGKKLIRGTVGSCNFVVKKKLYLDLAHNWVSPRAGDYFFFEQAYAHAKTFWWDKIVFKAPVGNGIPEIRPKRPKKGKKVGVYR